MTTLILLQRGKDHRSWYAAWVDSFVNRLIVS